MPQLAGIRHRSCSGCFLNERRLQAVYEAYGSGERVRRPAGLAPNGMNFLDALGLAEKLKARGSSTRLEFSATNGPRFGETLDDQRSTVSR